MKVYQQGDKIYFQDEEQKVSVLRIIQKSCGEKYKMSIGLLCGAGKTLQGKEKGISVHIQKN
ncbi:hypothetical protein HFZ78_18040 [Priestia megaterium]|uniref:Uncharacterized protein n=1 Tax=Priestia megaterium TaxID=1404 RepID=A0A6H1P4L3_PRIMG|nr:hypothetical protein [Priestia megaterium]QIZ08382.1 hypothetical protein HFZ78_18040 [Priestia megaterium]